MKRRTRVLVYSCSGCSNVAQLANRLAVELDRSGIAEMSCIAGVGGDVAPLVSRARSQRPVLAIDGCALHCTLACLQRHDITPDCHVALSELGLKKRYREDFKAHTAGRLHEQARQWVAAAEEVAGKQQVGQA